MLMCYLTLPKVKSQVCHVFCAQHLYWLMFIATDEQMLLIVISILEQ
jgi:hypothetical protein